MVVEFVLKNSLKIFILSICAIVLFIPIISAEENLCEYENLKLKIDDLGNINVESNYRSNSVLKEYLSIFGFDLGSIELGTPDLKNQISSLSGYCPDQIYTCRFQALTFNSGFAHFFINSGNNASLVTVVDQVYLFKSEQ